jgi:AraC family transcriptional regulator
MEPQAVSPISIHDASGMSLPVAVIHPESNGEAVRLPDVYSLRVTNFGSREPFCVPPLKEHTIAIPVRGKGRMAGKIETQVASFRPTRPGTGLGLIPAGMGSEWCFSGDHDYVVVFLSQAAMACSALTIPDLDASRIELIPSLFFTDSLIYQLGTTISRCMGSKNPFDLLYIESLCHTLTLHLLRHHSCSPPSKFTFSGKLSGRSLKKIIDYIAGQPLEYLKITNLAKLVNLSPFHFERLFKTTIGKTIHQFVLEHQLKKSLPLVLKSDLTIARIAAEMGFADQAHFDRQFKATYGVAPGRLRKDSLFFPSSPHENTSH